jgi:hypothetical protein
MIRNSPIYRALEGIHHYLDELIEDYLLSQVGVLGVGQVAV